MDAKYRLQMSVPPEHIIFNAGRQYVDQEGSFMPCLSMTQTGCRLLPIQYKPVDTGGSMSGCQILQI